MSERVVVIGAGVGGLTAAALLAQRGCSVTVLEAHVYAGGCAGVFYHRGYRFDAGATLAAGFEPGGGMTRLGERLGITWPVERTDVAMQVYLPDGGTVTRWTDPAAWARERSQAFGRAAEGFWRWQEATADQMWALALAGVPWPPQGAREWAALAGAGLRTVRAHPFAAPALAADALRPVAARLQGASPRLRHYVDGQLLIAAQAPSSRTNALYAAAALDMPRRGIAHVHGGAGQISVALADAVRRYGGQVRFRHRVTAVRARPGGFLVCTHKGAEFPAEQVIFNLPPWDAAALLGETAPGDMAGARLPADGWGAFMVYAGLDAAGIAPAAPLHHQVLLREPLGEGNSVFLSLSLPEDAGTGPYSRAPAGHRTATLSTHTDLRPWWRLFETDRPAYEARKAAYTDRVLAAAEGALPGLRAAARLVLPGTPVTFQRFTGRSRGWVGGFPQTSLFRAWSPRRGPGLWLVGDSIFPGQSILATALGGLRVAHAVERSLGAAPNPC